MKRNSVQCLLLFIAAAGLVFGTADASNDNAAGLVGSDDRGLLLATSGVSSASGGSRPSPSRPSGPSGSGPSLSGSSGSSASQPSRPRPSPTFSSPSRPSPSGPSGSSATQPSRPQPSPTFSSPSRRSPPTNAVPVIPVYGSVPTPTFRRPLWPQPSPPYSSPSWLQSSSPSELFASPDQASIPLWIPVASEAAASRVSFMFVFAVLGLAFGPL
jgi:hypothetical protein